MAWLCDCDDGTAEMKKERPRPPQQQQRMQGQAAANQMRAPPSEGELAPEFSRPRPELEGQTEAASSLTAMRTRSYSAMIEAGGPSSSSRKKSSIGDVIRTPDQPGQGVAKSSSRDSRKSDKDGAQADGNGPSSTNAPEIDTKGSASSSSSTSTTTSEKYKRRKSRRKHRHRDSGPCCCPMYEVEVIQTAGGKQRLQPGSKPGMQVVTTETVTKRLYTYNMNIDLPEGVRISPRGKLVEDQGVSAENPAYDNMQQYGAQPTYQSPYGQAYSQPQRPQLMYPPQDQMGAPAERYMQLQQRQISANGRSAAIMRISSNEMLPLREASPPLMSQNLGGQMQTIHPLQKVDSLVFQCLCGHDRGERKSSTTTTTTTNTNTSSTTSPTSTSTKTTRTSNSSRKKGRRSSTSTTTTKSGSKKKGNKSGTSSTKTNQKNSRNKTSTSSTSTKTSLTKNGNKSGTSSTSTKTSQTKNGNKSSTSSTTTKTSQKNKENRSSSSSSSSSSSTTSTSTSSTLKKNECKSGFVQVQIRCDKCKQRKTYLVCRVCYSRHKITTCKDCKGTATTEYIRYPSQNDPVRMAGRILPCRPALPCPPPESYQQQQLQPYGEDDMVRALSNANAALIVCCSSRTMLPANNAGVYRDPGAAYGHGPVTTNFVLGIVNASDVNESSSTSSSTTTTTSSSRTPVKSRRKSRTRSRDKTRTR